MIDDLNPHSIDPDASPEHFSIKITANLPFFPGERIASPAFFEGTLRPYIYVQYSLTSTLPKPDLTLFESSIETDPVWPKPLTSVKALAKIRNTGAATTYDVRVDFYDGIPGSGGVHLGYEVIPQMAGGGFSATATVELIATPGRHDIHVVVDSNNTISETDEENNTAFNTILVSDGYSFYHEGFEFGFGDWIYDFDTPMEYPTGRNRLSLMHPTREVVFKGKQALYAYLDGRGDDGTVWIERSVPVPRNTDVDVELSFAFGTKADLATAVMYFIDIYDPEVELDFTDVAMANGWKVYTFTKSLNTEDRNRLFFGAGFSARWELELSKYLDEFRITVKTPDGN